MRPKHRIWRRLLLSHLVVVAIGSATLFVAVGLVAPGAFDAAMGHAVSGMDGMTAMMASLIRGAFQDAIQGALVIAVAAAAVASIAASVALSSRLSRPIGRLVEASRRIASGRYTERVPVASDDEVGVLADTFNAMAASLEANERRRLELVGDVAHELRTPLATLEAHLEGLEDGLIPPDPKTWRLLRSETGRLTRMVNDLQELWRAEARQLPLSSSAVDVAGELQAARERLGSQAAEHDIEVRVAAVTERLAVRADEERLRQILDNLVGNAIRYSPRGSVVTLAAKREPGAVEITVTDEGPGLTPEQLEHVFERFYRVDPSRSRALGGSGIGLAIARALAEAMGGRADARSAGPGLGTTFRVTLPEA